MIELVDVGKMGQGTISTVCAWCNGELGSKAAEESFTTHGICPACTDRVLHCATPSREFLDLLDVPVFLLDDSRRIIIANQQACMALDRPRGEIEGFLGGEVYQCEYAGLPGGCGRTIHCSGCAIRRSVAWTKETGEALDRVPATLRRGNEEGSEPVHFLVSTRLVGTGVLLMVEDAEATCSSR